MFFLYYCYYYSINNNMLAFIALFIMYTGVFWYTPPKKQETQRKQYRFVESTSNNETYDRAHLF